MKAERAEIELPKYTTVRDYARQLGVKQDRVLQLIHEGRLRAINIAPAGNKMPNWRIPLSAIAEFESENEYKADAPARRTRNRKRGKAAVKHL